MSTLALPRVTGHDAISRIDDGAALPGDRQLAAAYDQHCQSGWPALVAAREAAQRADWLAVQCPECGPDGATGPVCDHCI